MARPVRHSYGIRIEGIGSDVDKPEGLCFYHGNRISNAKLAASDFEWVGGPGSAEGMISLPEGSDSTVSLWTASLSLSSIEPRLHLSDKTARALMKRVLEPTSYLVADLSLSATTIKFTDDLDASFENTVIYVGDEAILLGSVVAGTPDGEQWFGGCTRAYWGSHAQVNPTYRRVYDGVPYRKAREVTLVRFDHADDSEDTRWFGLLNDAPPSNEEHTTLDIKATEIFSPLKASTVNRGAPDLVDDANAIVFTILTVNDEVYRLSGGIKPRQYRTRQVDVDAGNAHNAAFQFGDEGLLVGEYNTTTGEYEFTWPDNGQGVLGSILPEGSGREALSPVNEVLLVSADLDLVDGVQRAAADMASSTAGLEYPFHPVAVWLAMTVDHPDYNILGEKWNLGSPPDWFDLTDLEATIEATQHLVIDHWVGGWNGEEVNPWEHFKRWCRTYGLFGIVRPDGRMSCREAREAGPEEVFNAPTVTSRPYRLHWRPSEGDGIDVISGKYGELPWKKGSAFAVLILDFADPNNPVPQNSRRSGVLASRNVGEIDMPTRSNVSATADELQGMAAARAIGAPKFGIRVNDEGFGHGDFVRLAPLNTNGKVLVDDTGERLEIETETAKWVGIVVGKNPDFERDVADIDIHLANRNGKFPRFRSASAVVTSVSGNTLTLKSGVFADDDGEELTVGDQVEVWTRLFVRRGGGVRTITAINSDEIVLDDGSSIEASDIIELAKIDQNDGYPPDGNPALYDGLAYVFMGDSDGTIGPDDDDAHPYGSGSA